MNALVKFIAVVLLGAGMASVAMAQTKQSAPQAMPTVAMTMEQMQQTMQQQQASFEQFLSAQKAVADANKARFETAIKTQQAAAEKHQQALLEHMQALHKQMEQVAAQTRKVVEAQAEAQQRQIYGYMLGQLSEGKMKEAFKKSEIHRLEMLADMKVKREQIEKKIEAAQQEAMAKMAEMQKKFG
jgi:hypothetical protein